jgi:cyanophycin synthetase
MGEIAGGAFDRVVIRAGHYLRGRDAAEVARLLEEGINRNETKPQVRIIPDGRDAFRHAIKYARKGELIVTLADIVPNDISYVQEIRETLAAEAEGKQT